MIAALVSSPTAPCLSPSTAASTAQATAGKASRLRIRRHRVPGMDCPAPDHLDGYRIGPLLGQGGMSRVYRAKQMKMERAIALKVMSPIQRQDEMACHRFIREGRLAGRIQHTNVVTYHE
ncbi:MAG: hypothetical protein PF961_23570, partial [Planctomycetota bacterium]|nr:hypothetical protein [Planctomycetota bacterium]